MSKLSARPFVLALLVLATACAPERATDPQPWPTLDPAPRETDGGCVTGGLPTEVANILGARCTSCHARAPMYGAPMALVSLADLQQPAPSTPSKTSAELSLARMKDASRPMPPGQLLDAAEVAVVEAWVTAGAAPAACTDASPDAGSAPAATTPDAGTEAPDAGSPPVATGVPDSPATCTSARYWSGGNEGSSHMHPGRACIQCHAGGEAPAFRIAGTLYPTTHEPNDCLGFGGRASVEVTDAHGKTVSLTANSSGNFSYEGTLANPLHVRVKSDTGIREMLTAPPSGDCNSCHTQGGTNGAPGRIVTP
jgi:hypothetical protein